ncbi:MAG: putative lipid II flippase FtsW [Acidimicrobiia bacterium]|nr:MAG: putative lipid II flippase FtsW [Acidimicrobiia bacterium]
MAGTASITTSRAALRQATRHAQGVSRSIGFVLVPVGLLIVVGLGVLISASSVVGLRESGDGLFYFKRQLVGLVVGIAGMVAAAFVPLRWWRRASFPLFLISLALLVAVLGFGIRMYGATRWLVVGPVSLQPSELAKLTTILFLATLVSRNERNMTRLWPFLWPLLASVGSVGVLVMLQPDLGTTLLVAAGGFAILAASTIPLRLVLGSALSAGAGAFLLAYTSPYRWARVTAFLDLQRDPLGTSYQALQSLVALGTGGVWGVGLGASRARWSFLPNAHTDFAFAILGEEIGMVGTLAVATLFTVFTVAGISIARNCTDPFGRLVAVGITTWLSMQAIVNVGGVTGLLPITGVPLPFVSYGGTSLVISLVGVGVLMSAARHPVEIDVGAR